jgi:hypothetical protein
MALEKRLSVPTFAGSGDGWGGSLPLRRDYPEVVVLDLSKVQFVVPTFLLRVRTFVDWHLSQGREVRVLPPASNDVNRYLSRMRVSAGLPDGTFDGLKKVSETDQREALIPVTRLHQLPEVDSLADNLAPLIGAHLAEVKLPLQPFFVAVSELAGNAVEHGRSESGCYVAAQRYRAQKRLTLAIADLGIGVPEHVRQRYPEWTDDARAIAMATQEAVSGTSEQHRGYGFYWVLEEAKAAEQVGYAQLTVRSSRGQYTVTMKGDQLTHRRADRGYKRGTWVCFELETA